MLLTFLLAIDPASIVTATATVIIAVSTIVYMVASVLLFLKTRESVNLTKRMFELSHRPRIGIIGKMQRINRENEVKFVVNYINGGTDSAHDVSTHMTLIVDGYILPNIQREEEPTFFMLPNHPRPSSLFTTELSEVTTINNAGTISIVFKCTYKGSDDKQYSYEERFSYDKSGNNFPTVKVIAD